MRRLSICRTAAARTEVTPGCRSGWLPDHGFQSSGRSSSKAEPDVTGVYRRVKSRKRRETNLCQISPSKNSDNKVNKTNRQQNEKTKKCLTKKRNSCIKAHPSKL